MTYITMTPRVNVGDYVSGERDSPIIVIEFGDYLSLESKELFKVMMRVRAMNRGKMAYVFRCLPDQRSSPFSDMAGRSVQAAGLQGKYWQMHQKLFETSERVDKDRIYYCAQQLGLDMDAFERELNGQKCLSRMMQDIETANRCGISKGPVIFVNKRKYGGAYEIKAIDDFINNE
ncbi:hypothetical protein FUAX_25460 [Fulvitalea axinellae]|uniref:Thioredoxin-like fold domain-containing protein n=1 Tax=Fulvitalea axinellae TaxID=1182444 RepID=A0AAU9D6G3_9BACT|nr:hypothetical protein FUAX_25460 [Fulvitalea axinellae]